MNSSDQAKAAALKDSVDGLTVQLKSVQDATMLIEKRRRKGRNIMTGCLVVLVLAIVSTVWGVSSVRDNVRENEANRAQARISACVQANVTTERQRAALVSSILTFADDPLNLSPGEQALLDRYTAEVEKQLPYRDCSPEGIDLYYEDPPADPADTGTIE
jgi:hypothetical protein